MAAGWASRRDTLESTSARPLDLLPGRRACLVAGTCLARGRLAFRVRPLVSRGLLAGWVGRVPWVERIESRPHAFADSPAELLAAKRSLNRSRVNVCTRRETKHRR